MVTIEVYMSDRGHIISWLYEADTEGQALRQARIDAQAKGLTFKDNYIIL